MRRPRQRYSCSALAVLVLEKIASSSTTLAAGREPTGVATHRVTGRLAPFRLCGLRRSCSCSISMKELVGLKTVLRDDGTRAIGRITWMQPGSNINQGPSRRTTRCFTSESINTQSSLQFL